MGGRIIYASSPVEDNRFLLSDTCGYFSSWTAVRRWGWDCLFLWGRTRDSTAGVPIDGSRISSGDERAALTNSVSSSGPDQTGIVQQQQQQSRVRYIYDTCVAVDCSQWLDAMASCTKARYPDVDIRVVHSSSSLTGFCIVFRLPPPSAEGYEYVSWNGANDSATSNDDAHQDESFTATPFFSLAYLNLWQKRWFKRASTCAQRLVRCVCFIPMSLLLRASQQRSHLLGMLVLYGMLHGTYILVTSMHGASTRLV